MRSHVNLSDHYKKYINLPVLTDADQKNLVKQYKAGDKASGDKLIAHNIKLVVMSVSRFSSFTCNTDDLIQEGSLGILQAATKFDFKKEVKFITYARWWIDAYVANYYNVNRTDVKHRSPSHSHTELSLDEPMHTNNHGGHDSELSLAEAIINDCKEQPDPVDRRLVWEEIREELIKTKRVFNGLDKAILEQRLLSEDPLFLETLGNKFGKSREWVRQREMVVKKRIKSIMSPHYEGYTV